MVHGNCLKHLGPATVSLWKFYLTNTKVIICFIFKDISFYNLEEIKALLTDKDRQGAGQAGMVCI